MNRRAFLGIAAASIFAPQFGRWYRQGSGLLVRDAGVVSWPPTTLPPDGWMTSTDALPYVVTGVGNGVLTVDTFRDGKRLPTGGHLRSRALFSGALTGRKPRTSEIRGTNVSDLRVGDVIRIPQPFSHGQMMILP